MEETQHYWRWSEKTWQAPDLDWRTASAVTVGVDVGSVSSQAVLLADGKLLAFHSTRTGSSSPDSALRALRGASEPLGLTLDDIAYAVGTGYGRVNVPFADRTITEIACHARGANYMGGPRIRTILDMGGQDCKVIRCDERGKVLNFIMNDKCAAGTGRGMEVIADVLSVPIEDIGQRSFEIDEEPPPVSNVCTVFAKSEATSLLRAGWSVNRVLAAYCSAMAQRVAGLIERMQVEREFFITGGIGKNLGVTKRIERLIGVEAVKLPPDSVLDPQIAGALGAALFAHSLYRKAQQGKQASEGPAGPGAAPGAASGATAGTAAAAAAGAGTAGQATGTSRSTGAPAS
jgi:benzoyl-CoA reductase subunit A